MARPPPFNCRDFAWGLEVLDRGGLVRVAQRAGLEVAFVLRVVRGHQPTLVEGQKLAQALEVEIRRQNRNHPP